MKPFKYILPGAILVLTIGACAPVNTTATSTHQLNTVTWAFTQADDHPEKQLIDLIHSSKTSLDIAIYSLTYPDIVQAIRDAKKRGVAVRIITDKQQSGGKTQQQALKLLKNAGIPIKINKHSGLMHLKVTVSDRKIATTGSFNYTKAASTTNDEVFVVINDPAAAKAFDEQFNRMWADTKGFINYSDKK